MNNEPLYIVEHADPLRGPSGYSHRVVRIGAGARPELACGTNSDAMNWTGSYTPRTRVCARCKAWEETHG